MGVYLKGITEDVFKEISWECVYLALKRQDRIVEVKEPHGRLIDADAYAKTLHSLGNRDYRRTKGTIADAVKFLQKYYTPTIIERSE